MSSTRTRGDDATSRTSTRSPKPRFSIEATAGGGRVVRYVGPPALQRRARSKSLSGPCLKSLIERLFLNPDALTKMDLTILAQVTEYDDTLLDRCESEFLNGALEASLEAVDGRAAACDVQRVDRTRAPKWSRLATQRCRTSAALPPRKAAPRARSRERRPVRPRRRAQGAVAGGSRDPGEPDPASLFAGTAGSSQHRRVLQGEAA